jgi:hypothetical protein
MNEKEIRNEIRTEIYKAISEMLDNPEESGIYPTAACYDRLENYFYNRERPVMVSSSPYTSDDRAITFTLDNQEVFKIDDTGFSIHGKKSEDPAALYEKMIEWFDLTLNDLKPRLQLAEQEVKE